MLPACWTDGKEQAVYGVTIKGHRLDHTTNLAASLPQQCRCHCREDRSQPALRTAPALLQASLPRLHRSHCLEDRGKTAPVNVPALLQASLLRNANSRWQQDAPALGTVPALLGSWMGLVASDRLADRQSDKKWDEGKALGILCYHVTEWQLECADAAPGCHQWELSHHGL
jgi:hypothetical protein